MPCAHHVSAQVNAEDGDGAQRKRNAGDDEEEEGRDLWDVAGQRVGNGLLQVVEDEATCRDQRRHPACVSVNPIISSDFMQEFILRQRC